MSYIHQGRVVSGKPPPPLYMYPVLFLWALAEGIYHFFSSLCHGAIKPATAGGVFKRPPPSNPYKRPPPPPPSARKVSGMDSLGSGTAPACNPGGG
jgi:hypothetical protein